MAARAAARAAAVAAAAAARGGARLLRRAAWALAALIAVSLVAGGMRHEPFQTAADTTLNSPGRAVLCGSIASSSVSNGCGRLLRVEGGRNVLDGDTHLAGNANVGGRLHFGDPKMTTAPDGANSSDSYYLQKVVAAPNASHLRLTLSDDPDESFQIWGDSCRSGNCAGGGAARHRFDAAGGAWHAGGVTAAGGAVTTGQLAPANTQYRNVDLNGITLARVPHAGWWAHGAQPNDVVLRTEGDNRIFLQNGHWNGLTVKGNSVGVGTPDPQARLHVAGGDARVDGAVRAAQLCIGATCVNEAALKKIK